MIAYNNSVTLDHSRPTHNMSATIEASRMENSMERGRTLQDDKARVQVRKRSMPPTGVHIPLLDFSKLHQPQ